MKWRTWLGGNASRVTGWWPGCRLPAPVVGDLVAMPVTGAYTYTLANNYNGALKPPIVFCRDGQALLAAARETHEHVLALHRPALDIAW